MTRDPLPIDVTNMLANGFGVEDAKVKLGLTWGHLATLLAIADEPRFAAHLRIAERAARRALPRMRA